ncbi:MAG: hypothetical protein ACHREM_22935, partial [Polyangiales bacterium]
RAFGRIGSGRLAAMRGSLRRGAFSVARRGIALATALIVVLAAACSLLVDTDASQCASDSDCAAIHVGSRCEQGVCVHDDAGVSEAGAIACAFTHDCAALAPSVCDPAQKVCVALQSPECPTILGDSTSDDAIVFGAIVPSPIDAPPGYLADLSRTGDALSAGLALAVSDFASSQNPTHALPPRPGSEAPRPMVFVVCSDQHSAAATARAAVHLAIDLRVPAILGTAFSSLTEVVASTLTARAPGATLLLAPRSAALGAADNGGLVARVAPADDAEGAAISALVADRAPSIAASVVAGDGGPPSLRVAVVYKDDSYGRAVLAAMRSTLRFNGTDVAGNGTNYREVSYGDPDKPGYSAQLASAALGVFNERPHIVIAIGTNEQVTGIVSQLEANWSAAEFRPYYFMSGGLAVPELWGYLASNDPTDSIRKRIVGTMPTRGGATYDAFASALGDQFPAAAPIVWGAAEYYDGAYLLGFSVAAIGDQDVTGATLNAGFALLGSSDGALQPKVGPSSIAETFAKLTAGEGVSLTGASNLLTFDATKRALTGGVTQVWCVPSVAGRAGAAILSGQSIDTATSAVKGTVSIACGL